MDFIQIDFLQYRNKSRVASVNKAHDMLDKAQEHQCQYKNLKLEHFEM